MVAETKIRKAKARAEVRDQDERRRAEELDRTERRRAEMEDERWERVDRRIERYVLLAVFVLGAIAAICLALLTVHSNQDGIRATPAAGAVVPALAVLRLRSLAQPQGSSLSWFGRRRRVQRP
jgi:hypothetical protein